MPEYKVLCVFIFFFLCLDKEIMKQPCQLQNTQEKKKNQTRILVRFKLM